MSDPNHDEPVKPRGGFAQALTKAEWEIKYGDRQRARKTARAWVGIIQLDVICSSEGYMRGFSTPYPPPKFAVVPAAPGVRLSQMGFQVTYLPAGSPFWFDQEHLAQITELFDGLMISRVPDEQYTRQTAFPENRVLVTWFTQCHDDTSPIPFNVFLLSPDGKERETSRVNTRLVAAFATEEAATAWMLTRTTELHSAHNRNHKRQCRDRDCALRKHTYVPRYNED